MKRDQIALFIIILGTIYVNGLFAQTGPVKAIDTLQHSIKPTDTGIYTDTSLLPTVSDNIQKFQNQLNQLKIENQAFKLKATQKAVSNKLQNAAKNKLKQGKDELGGIKLPKSTKIDYHLTLESSSRFQPIQPILGVGNYLIQPKFLNIFNIRGNVQLFGIPLNVDYSSNRFSSTSLSGLSNNLFKFDLNPDQISQMLQSDMEQYYSLKKNYLGGLDLSGYTKKLIADKLQAQTKSRLSAKNDTLTQYLSSSENLNILFKMDDEQIKKKLEMLVSEKTASAKKSALENYSDKADSVKQLYGVNEQQQMSNLNKQLIARYPQNKVQSRLPDSARVKIDSIVSAISGIKQKLKDGGFNIEKMQAMQAYLNKSAKNELTERESEFFEKKYGSKTQAVLANIKALKIGSFADNVSGNTDKKDLFISGTTTTFTTNAVPITIGYGVTNDIGAAKDGNYQSSVYNSPKNITYLGTTLRNKIGGKVNIAVIGATNRQYVSNAYSIPTTSSNSVTFTVTKDFNFGKLGQVAVDVSKSANVLDNNYQAGSEAILNKKGGLGDNMGAALFQALAIGINHHLDLPELGASDNFYFSYSGMGYQNPGNNGYGGARMKLGGNIKKSFYNNKLNITLRSDINNMPISYTSNDKWNSYHIQVDSRYNISKKVNISLKYSTNSTSKQVANKLTPVYNLQRFQMETNSNYKIGRHATYTHLSVGTQRIFNSYVTGSTGNILTMNYMQSMLFSSNSLTVNLFYNKELSSNKLIGDMFTSDLSYQYALFSKINMSSSVTFLSNSAIAKQTGIRQGIQIFANAHFDFDGYVDIRKNLITPTYPDLYSACRAELSIKYHLK